MFLVMIFPGQVKSEVKVTWKSKPPETSLCTYRGTNGANSTIGTGLSSCSLRSTWANSTSGTKLSLSKAKIYPQSNNGMKSKSTTLIPAGW